MTNTEAIPVLRDVQDIFRNAAKNAHTAASDDRNARKSLDLANLADVQDRRVAALELAISLLEQP